MFDDEEEKLIDNRKQKDEIQSVLDKHIAEYLARGGKVTRYKFGEMTQDRDYREVEFRTRMERDVKAKETEQAKNRETLIKKISAGKPIDLFGED